MYSILSYLPQKLLGVPLAQYVKKNIFDALGLNSTTYSYDVASKSGHLADGMDRERVNITENPPIAGATRPMLF
jgi:CubicO group peptidase (beta-lactamase class C family)